MLMAAEDHAEGCQYLRFRLLPKVSFLAIGAISFLAILLTLALSDGALVAGVIIGLLLITLFARIFGDFGRAYFHLKTVALNQDKLT